MGERKATKVRQHDPLFRGQVKCQNCGGIVTWQLQKGRYYGACQRRSPQCKGNPLIREDRLEDLVCEEIRSLDKKDTDRVIFLDLRQKLLESRQPYVGQHRIGVMKLINRQIGRNEMMVDNLYDDKTSGLITEEMYRKKLEEVEARLVQLRERLRRLELIEGKTKSIEVCARTVLGLYESESKDGKRLLISCIFKIAMVDGRVMIKSLV